MSITYRTRIITEPGIKGGGNNKFIAQIVYSGEIMEDEFVETFRQKSHINDFETAKKYCDAMQFSIIEYLQKGKRVRLQYLGIISPKFKSRMVDDEKSVNSDIIYGIDAYLKSNNFFKRMMQKTKLFKERKKGKKIIVEL